MNELMPARTPAVLWAGLCLLLALVVGFAAPAQSSDALMWARAKTCADYLAFAASYPGSKYAAQAKAKITAMRCVEAFAPKPAVAAPAPKPAAPTQAPTPEIAQPPAGPRPAQNLPPQYENELKLALAAGARLHCQSTAVPGLFQTEHDCDRDGL